MLRGNFIFPLSLVICNIVLCFGSILLHEPQPGKNDHHIAFFKFHEDGPTLGVAHLFGEALTTWKPPLEPQTCDAGVQWRALANPKCPSSNGWISLSDKEIDFFFSDVRVSVLKTTADALHLRVYDFEVDGVEADVFSLQSGNWQKAEQPTTNDFVLSDKSSREGGKANAKDTTIVLVAPKAFRDVLSEITGEPEKNPSYGTTREPEAAPTLGARPLASIIENLLDTKDKRTLTPLQQKVANLDLDHPILLLQLAADIDVRTASFLLADDFNSLMQAPGLPSPPADGRRRRSGNLGSGRSKSSNGRNQTAQRHATT